MTRRIKRVSRADPFVRQEEKMQNWRQFGIAQVARGQFELIKKIRADNFVRP
jgi:hypothetical protein